MWRLLLLTYLCMFALGASAAAPDATLTSDYAREKRWADEVVPGLLVGDPVFIKAATGKEFLALHAEAKNPRGAVVIVQGLGMHPDHSIIGVLRTRLTEMGYATLSIQMPVKDAAARAEAYYPMLFPDALNRITLAGEYLQKRGYKHIALISHNMGSWMSNVYLNQTPDAPYAAWVCTGLTGGFTTRILGMDLPMLSVKIPILDVYGENDMPPVLNAAARRKRSIADAPGSGQIMIAGADHFYTGKGDELAQTIADYLKERWGQP